MKNTKKFLSAVFAVLFVLSFCTMFASAKTESPIALTVSTSSTSVGSEGIVFVKVTAENVSDETVKNVVVTSAKSTGIAYFKLISSNVLISNGVNTTVSENSMVASLVPGGKITYTYGVVQSYQSAADRLSEFESDLMKVQHIVLNTKEFTDIKIKGSYTAVTTKLDFGGFEASLKVRAYYNLSDSVYSGLGIAEAPAAAEVIGSYVDVIKSDADNFAAKFVAPETTEAA